MNATPTALSADTRAPTARENRVLQKDLDARRRACLNGDQTHLRAGTWRDLDDAEVELVGHLQDLHGTVCSCCPERGAA